MSGDRPRGARAGGLHLGIDALRLARPQTGVARYLANLLREWAGGEMPFARITVFAPSPHAAIPSAWEAIGGPRRSGAAWQHAWLPVQARRRRVDLLFCPAYIAPLGYRGRYVVTIHDAIQEARPADFSLAGRVRHAPLYRVSARGAGHILTDSAAAADDIRHHYGTPAAQITAVPLAAESLFHPRPAATLATTRARYGLDDRPFVLFVGKLSPRRNLPALLDAFASIVREEGLPHRLVLAGLNHHDLPIARLARELGIADRLRFPGYIPDEDLASLYAAADLFAYPSEMEGFGLPILEAMASGAPVLTLRRGAMAEVAGEAACYADDGSSAALRRGMAPVLRDGALRADLRRRGLARAAAFSWGETARRTLAVLDAVARGTAVR